MLFVFGMVGLRLGERDAVVDHMRAHIIPEVAVGLEHLLDEFRVILRDIMVLAGIILHVKEG